MQYDIRDEEMSSWKEQADSILEEGLKDNPFRSIDKQFKFMEKVHKALGVAQKEIDKWQDDVQFFNDTRAKLKQEVERLKKENEEEKALVQQLRKNYLRLLREKEFKEWIKVRQKE